MAEANGRMNGSRCFPPPALCLRFPALQACTEDLPLALQRPDSFPLVMGILQEMNYEKVGCPRGLDNTFIELRGSSDQHGLRKVKLENLDLEEDHQDSYDTNPGFCQEWSLKGVEEMLADSEELHLKHDGYQQQAHEALSSSELASTQDAKPLFGLQQSTESHVSKKALDEAELLVDEKPPPCSQLRESLHQQVPSQGRASLFEESSEVKPTVLDLQAAIPANNKGHQQPLEAFVEERLGLDTLKVVKTELDGNVGYGEAELQDRCYLRYTSTSMSSEVGHGKENMACTISQQLKKKKVSNLDTELNKREKATELIHNTQVRKGRSCGLPEKGDAPPKADHIMTINSDCELMKRSKITSQGQKLQADKVEASGSELNLETEHKKQWIVHDIERTASAILALPAKFTEQEKSQVPQNPISMSNSLATKGKPYIPVSTEGRGDSPEVFTDFKSGGKQQSIFPEAELAFCELTLSLGSSQPETASLCPSNTECVDCPEEKPLVKIFSVQEEHDAQLQRTNLNQWQQATRSGSHNTIPSNKKPLLPKCHTDGEASSKVMRSLSKTFELYGSPAEEVPEKKLLFKKGKRSSSRGNRNHIEVGKSCSDRGTSRKTFQLLPRGSEDGGSTLGEEVERLVSEGDQLAGPNQKTVEESFNVQPSRVSSQSEQAPEFNGPHKKRMRGTLPIEEKGNGVQKDTDTRCHRSDGKSWRCTRECINGAYYCQYHLRARRIGYNRRKNRDTDTHHRESASKKSSKVGKKSRQLLSASKCNNKP